MTNDLQSILALAGQSGREEDLSNHISGVLGAIILLDDSLEGIFPIREDIGHNMKRISWKEMYLRCMDRLLVPNTFGSRVTRLVSRRYKGSPDSGNFVDCGYYRY